jgi:CHAD domain-containing protein
MTGRTVSEIATKLLERLAFQVNHTLHTANSEAVHDLRVAIRRFSQALAIGADAFPGKEVKKIRRRLKEVMELTNAPRDCDVALKLLPKSALPAAAALEPKIRAYRKEQVRLLIPALRSWASRRTSGKWRAVLAPNGSAQEEFDLSGEAPRLLKRVLKHASRAESADDLHRLRIDGKKLRYTLELLPDAHWAPALETLARAQTLLGQVNDCRAVRKLMQELGGAAEVERWLKRRQKKRTNSFREEWPAIESSLRAALAAPRRRPMGRSTTRKGALALHA